MTRRTTAWMARALAAAALFPWSYAAHAAEYRIFTLADGRVLVAEVLATEAAGMRVRVPQGETVIPFTMLRDMAPVDQQKYDEQDDWLVYVAADEMYRQGFVTTFDAVRHVDVVGQPDAPEILTPEQLVAAAQCDIDIECIASAIRQEGRWMWVVVGQMEGSEVVFRTAVTTGSTRGEHRAPRVDAQLVTEVAYESIGLTSADLTPEESQVVQVIPEEPVGPVLPEGPSTTEPRPPKVPKPHKERTALSSDQVGALSFVPIPGFTSARQGDMAGFGMAMAAVVPATVLWVGATGKETQSTPQHALLAVGGYYAATVLVNQVFGARSSRRATPLVGISPTEEGGASLQLTITPGSASQPDLESPPPDAEAPPPDEEPPPLDGEVPATP